MNPCGLKTIPLLFYSLSCLITIVFSQHTEAQTFFEQHQKGWFWYEKLAPEKKLPPQVLNPTERMQALQARIEQRLNLAILEPTEAHLKDYAEHYWRAIHQAQHFTDQYQNLLLKYPALDYGLKFPASPLAQAIYDREQHQQIGNALKTFAQTQGIFFFFKGDCAYCQVFGPVLKAFAKDYGIEVLPVSLDGKGLADFQNFHSNQGIADLLQITHLPFVVAVNPQTQAITPLAHGAISYSQLEQNIARVLQRAGGSNEPF